MEKSIKKLDQKLRKSTSPVKSRYDKPVEPKKPRTYTELAGFVPTKSLAAAAPQMAQPNLPDQVAEPHKQQVDFTSLALKSPEALTPVDKKMIKAERLSAIWLQVSKLAHEQNYQHAYEMALSELDDVYLLRLIMQTGPVISRGLTDSVGKKVLHRLNRVIRGGMLYKMQTEWLADAVKQDLFSNLSKSEKNEQMDTMYQLAATESDLVKPAIKERAAEVYSKIKQNQAAYKYY